MTDQSNALQACTAPECARTSARMVDSLGRVVIPSDILHALDIRESDVLDIGIDCGRRAVILARRERNTPCALCGTQSRLIRLDSGLCVCYGCAAKAVEAARRAAEQ